MKIVGDIYAELVSILKQEGGVGFTKFAVVSGFAFNIVFAIIFDNILIARNVSVPPLLLDESGHHILKSTNIYTHTNK